MPIEQVIDDLALCEKRTAIHGIGEPDPDRVCADVRPVLPAQRVAFLREVERVECVGPGRHDVHRVLDDERLALVSAQHARGKRPDGMQRVRILRGDLREPAVARGGVILRWHTPLTVVGRSLRRARGLRDVG